MFVFLTETASQASFVLEENVKIHAVVFHVSEMKYAKKGNVFQNHVLLMLNAPKMNDAMQVFVPKIPK